MKYSFFHSSSLLFSKIKVAADGIHDFFFPDVVAAVGPVSYTHLTLPTILLV